MPNDSNPNLVPPPPKRLGPNPVPPVLQELLERRGLGGLIPSPPTSIVVGGRLVFLDRPGGGDREVCDREFLADALQRRPQEEPVQYLPEREIRPPLEGEPPPRPFSLFRIPPVGDTPSPVPAPVPPPPAGSSR